jgi:hypothetical protein
MAQGKVLASTADGPTDIADIRGRGIQFKRPQRQPLSQVTGLQLGGLTGDLSGAVGDTLSQVTGLHFGAVTVK